MRLLNEITISKPQARRFLMLHHRLLPPRKLKGKEGTLEYLRHVNCIQYDPINVVGQNPHLVLQSRVRGYRRAMLDELLYKERKLIDGFDKVMSIYPAEDWPSFSGYRKEMGKRYINHESSGGAAKLIKWVKKELRERGPLSSLELEEDSRIQWWWGNNARAARIALDLMFISGEVVVHHRVGTRRYFDLAERWPGKNGKDPHPKPETYKDWHVLRRVGGLGLLRPGGNNPWVGIRSRGGSARAAFARLLKRGDVLRVNVDGAAGGGFYMRTADLPTMELAGGRLPRNAGAAFLAPLDNLMWDRDILLDLFDFFYRWEVYVPEPKRKYGYYVLPVIFGDQFVARMDPAFDRKTGVFTVKNWWWEQGTNKKDEAMGAALQAALKDFAKYLGAKEIALGENAKKDKVLKKLLREF